MKVIVNGENAIVGRLGSFAAKELLKGNSVDIINSDKAIISGNKKVAISKVEKLRAMGGTSRKGPRVSRLPERVLKRMIRGMLPWDKARGRDAFKRLRCYSGNDLSEEEMKNVIVLKHNRPLKKVTIKQISEALG